MKTEIQPRVVRVTITQEELRELVWKAMTQDERYDKDPCLPEELQVTVEGLMEVKQGLAQIKPYETPIQCAGCNGNCTQCGLRKLFELKPTGGIYY